MLCTSLMKARIENDHGIASYLYVHLAQGVTHVSTAPLLRALHCRAADVGGPSFGVYILYKHAEVVSGTITCTQN